MPSYERSAAIRRRWFLLSLIPVLFIFSSATKPQLQARTRSKGSVNLQAPVEWKRYSVKDRSLAVSLPTMPASITSNESGGSFEKLVMRNIIGAYAQGVVYGVFIFERKQSLEEFIEEFSRPRAGEFKRELNVDGNSGKEYVFQNDALKEITQYFITRKHLYAIKATGSLLGDPNLGMSRFFDSVKFGSNPIGLEIVDGPGDQPAVDSPRPATDGNDKVLSGREVTRKVVVVSKPEPSYTQAARKHGRMGTVVLRCIFASSGAVTNIRTMAELPDGLTENAIGAARQIKFIPAIKNGHFVSMYIQLEYNFNLF